MKTRSQHPIPQENPGVLEKMREGLRVFMASLVASVKYVWADLRRNKRTMLVAVITVALVVGFVLLLQNSISRAPIIFLKLAENQVGESDLVLQPLSAEAVQNLARSTSGTSTLKRDDSSSGKRDNSSTTAPSPSYSSNGFGLNYTFVNEQLRPVEGTVVAGAAPRWTMLARATSEHASVNSSAVVLAIDSVREKEIGLGRDWHHRPLGQQEAHVSRSLLYQLGVEPNTGGRVTLTVPIGELFGASGALDNSTYIRDRAEAVFVARVHARNFTTETTQGEVAQLLGLPEPPNADQPLNVTVVGSDIPDPVLRTIFDQFFDAYFQTILASITDGFQAEFTVVDAVDDPKGKWSASLGNVAVIESKYLTRLIRTLLPENSVAAQAILSILGIPDDQIQNIEDFPINVCFHSFFFFLNPNFFFSFSLPPLQGTCASNHCSKT